jgi:hypothetical protein
MKKIRCLLILCAAMVLLLAACKKDCKIDYPKDIKPIDWDNYNDVYTVYWNYRILNPESNDKSEQNWGKYIMVCGWIFQGIGNQSVDPKTFALINKRENIFEPNFFTNNGVGMGIRSNYFVLDTIIPVNIDTLNDLFSKTDLTRKCFIKGKLTGNYLPDNHCNWVEPMIVITDINDIYFEE